MIQQRYSASRASRRPALVAISGWRARTARSARTLNDPMQTRATARARVTSSTTARASSTLAPFSSMMILVSRYRSSTAASVGTSNRDSSAAVRPASGPDPRVVRPSVRSWCTTTIPSRERWTSNSSPSAPAARPRSKAGIVFSGPILLPPLCANTSGRDDSSAGCIRTVDGQRSRVRSQASRW